MARAGASLLAGFAALTAAVVLSACGGDDDNGTGTSASEGVHSVAFDKVQALRDGLSTKQAFRKLGATPEQEYEKLGGKSGDVLYVCYRFVISDGGPSDRAELCFERNKELTSIGATRTAGGGGPVPGVPASP